MKIIEDLIEYLSLDPSQLADTELICAECGRHHPIPFKKVFSGTELIERIPEVIEETGYKNKYSIGILYDFKIEKTIEEHFLASFSQLRLPFHQFPLGDEIVELDADVDLGDAVAKIIPPQVQVLIGVGSGVVSDLTKWIATKCKLPFIIVGTAGSMNGYTSITATMTEKNIKTSKWLNPAEGVLLDSKMLETAPLDMTQSGIADLLARNVSNADWKLAQLLRGSYFCSVPYRMMIPFQTLMLNNIESLGKNDLSKMKILADAILVSGYSMTILDGETSPSSGSEHIISHFFDFQHKVFNLPKNFHGTQVGIGTILMSTAYDVLREMNPAEFNLVRIIKSRMKQPEIEKMHVNIFGKYDILFNKVTSKKRIRETQYKNYLENIINSWDEIWESLDPFLMKSEEIKFAMEAAGAVTKISGVNRSEDEVLQAILFGSHYRSRYTILDLFWELGLFPESAPDIITKSGVLD